MRFFKRDDESAKSASAAEPRGVPPRHDVIDAREGTTAAMESAIASNGWTYGRTEDGTCLVKFNLPDGALIPSIMVALIPVPGFVIPQAGREPLESPSTIQVIATGMNFSQDELAVLLRACNNWNRDRWATVASVRTNTDSGELDLFVEGTVRAGRDGWAGSLGRDIERITTEQIAFCVRLRELGGAKV